MSFLLRLPVVRTLHQRQLLFPVMVLLIVGAVLVEGTLDRSGPAQAEEETGFDEPAPRPVLRADLEKTPLTYFSDYWSQLAEGARPNLTSVGAAQTPAILVGPGLALTTLEPALEIVEARDRARLTSAPEAVDAAGGDPVETDESPAPPADPEVGSEPEEDGSDVESRVDPVEAGRAHRLRSWNAEIGLALFDVVDSNETAFTLSDPRTLPSGSYLGAVTLDRSGRSIVTPGSLVTAHSGPAGGELVVSMDLPDTLSIAAVVNLDGALVGVAYAAPDGPRVVTSTEMLGLLEDLQVETRCRGIEVSDLSDEVRELLEVDGGVLVEFVDSAAFEPVASLRGGDILVEWGGEEIATAEQFIALYDNQEAGTLVSYRAMRGRRRVTGGVVMHAANCAPLSPEPVRLTRFGLAVQWMPDQTVRTFEDTGWAVVAVAPDSTSAEAGVQEGDWLRALGGQALNDEQDRAFLESAADSDEGLLLSLLREGRTKLVAVFPPAEGVETDADGPGDGVEPASGAPAEPVQPVQR